MPTNRTRLVSRWGEASTPAPSRCSSSAALFSAAPGAAVAIAGAAGLETETVRQAILKFTPVPHRLELVGSVGGVAYYNDSIATTPERSLAAIRSFQEPIVLLLGGRGKQLPLDELSREAIDRLVNALAGDAS